MNLLYIAPANSIHTKRWVEFFSQKPGIDVQVITFSKPTVRIEGATIHFVDLEGTSRFKPVRMLQIRKRIREEVEKITENFKPEVVHIHFIDAHAYFSARLTGAPFIATAWGSDILVLPKKNLVNRWIAKKAIKDAYLLMCDAAHMKERMVELGAPPEKVEIIFFGTNLEDYNPRRRDPGLSRELGWEKDSKLVISTRGLKEIYNVETFIRAAPLVLEKNPDARFIVGSDGNQREMLTSMANELKIPDKVKFTGYLSDDDLKRYVASADVYVSTALSDGGIAASTAEAMASGVPVVVTDFGDNKEWLDDGKAGLSFAAKDHRALAERITDLLSSELKRRQMGECGRGVIDQKNNYHKEMSKVLEIYERITRKTTA